MVSPAAFVTFAALLLATAAAVHIYWALGGRRGHDAAIPSEDGKPMLRPGKLATLLVAALLLGAAILLLGGGDVIALPLPAAWETAACWGLALVFAARAVGDFRYVGFFKRVRDTRFARLDSVFYSPLCVLLGLAAAVAAL